jgi:hypothetical protein
MKDTISWEWDILYLHSSDLFFILYYSIIFLCSLQRKMHFIFILIISENVFCYSYLYFFTQLEKLSRKKKFKTTFTKKNQSSFSIAFQMFCFSLLQN